MVYTDRGTPLRHRKEGNEAIYSNTDSLAEDHTAGRKTEKEKHHVTSLTCGILKNDTNEFLYRTKTDSKTLNTKVSLPKRERVGKG